MRDVAVHMLTAQTLHGLNTTNSNSSPSLLLNFLWFPFFFYFTLCWNSIFFYNLNFHFWCYVGYECVFFELEGDISHENTRYASIFLFSTMTILRFKILLLSKLLFFLCKVFYNFYLSTFFPLLHIPDFHKALTFHSKMAEYPWFTPKNFHKNHTTPFILSALLTLYTAIMVSTLCEMSLNQISVAWLHHDLEISRVQKL